MCRGITVHRGLSLWMFSVFAVSWFTLVILMTPVDASAETFWQQGRETPLSTQPSPPDFTALAKELQPAVVNISTKQQAVRPDEDSPMEFFERFFGPGRPGAGDRDRVRGLSSVTMATSSPIIM